MDLPADFKDQAGPILIERRFGRPRASTSDGSRIFLVLEDFAGLAEVVLNGLDLGSANPERSGSIRLGPITLQARNRLVIALQAPEGGRLAAGPVTLVFEE